MMDPLAGMDPLQRARYDAAVQRYHDTVAAHRARLESELRKAKDAIAELNRRHDPKRRAANTGESAGANGAIAGDAMAEGAFAVDVASENTAAGNTMARDTVAGERDRRTRDGSRIAGGPVRSILNKGG
ncbi:hypothetical protein ACFORJ_02875 [Corynebacterium hansenii]|uniref:Uncharacterized protein n=1 Tax=Corynebacterium hansenii TaxID=394964 RepID=A0ABV7ZPE6_9CORY|nr:hypothetical protein [Corynebacterium hansenii]WJY99058.1 hypothetical protein CHAN_02135 [Corynebacterium hansenii]